MLEMACVALLTGQSHGPRQPRWNKIQVCLSYKLFFWGYRSLILQILQKSGYKVLYTSPGDTPIYGLYRYVPRNRVWFLRFSVLIIDSRLARRVFLWFSSLHKNQHLQISIRPDRGPTSKPGYLTGLSDRCGLCWYTVSWFSLLLFLFLTQWLLEPLGWCPKQVITKANKTIYQVMFTNSVGPQWVQRFKYHFGLLLPYQNESFCKTILMKIHLFCTSTLMQIKHVFIRNVLHGDLLWNRGKSNLEMAYWFPDSLLQCQALETQIWTVAIAGSWKYIPYRVEGSYNL